MRWWSAELLQQPSKLDWCEPNYVEGSQLAEWWNSISNVAFSSASSHAVFAARATTHALRPNLVAGLASLAQHTLGGEYRFALLALTQLLLLAPGSFAFHATLTMGGQLLDELAMMLSAAVWTFCVFTTGRAGTPPMSAASERRFAFALAAAFGGWLLIAPCVHIDHNDLFQLAFLLPILACALRLLWLAQFVSKREEFAVRWYIGCVLSGSLLWMLDKHFCDALQSTGLYALRFGSLHGYWHTLIGITVYVGPAICRHLRCVQCAPHLRTRIALISPLAVPVVHQQSDGTKLANKQQ